MIVEGLCRPCGKWFNAHFSQYPESQTVEAIMHPYCTTCKSHDVVIFTDEDCSEDSCEMEDYDDED